MAAPASSFPPSTCGAAPSDARRNGYVSRLGGWGGEARNLASADEPAAVDESGAPGRVRCRGRPGKSGARGDGGTKREGGLTPPPPIDPGAAESTCAEGDERGRGRSGESKGAGATRVVVALSPWPCPGESTMTKKLNVATHLHYFFSLSFSLLASPPQAAVKGLWRDGLRLAFFWTSDDERGSIRRHSLEDGSELARLDDIDARWPALEVDGHVLAANSQMGAFQDVGARPPAL